MALEAIQKGRSHENTLVSSSAQSPFRENSEIPVMHGNGSSGSDDPTLSDVDELASEFEDDVNDGL
jgi:hypothetical protein